jgi:hypothetical protein
VADRGRGGGGVVLEPDPEAPAYADRRESMITIMADEVERQLDLDTMLGWTRIAS